MAVHYRTRGFVIKKTGRGEADQLFTIYTQDFGKLEVLGKAVRKIKSKLRGGIGLFYLSEIEFIQGKKTKTLTGAILIEKFPNIRKSLKKLAVAHKIAENLDDSVRGQEPDKKTWELLIETFGKLNNLQFKINHLPLVYYYFLWNFISILGYRPEFKDCLLNGQKIACDIVKVLKLILRKDWPILSRLKIQPLHQKLLKNVSQDYLSEILGRN
ncbi:MAG: DNA repair protein RecO [Candidatus Nealsonbacteria bacterium RIFCSPLOWO2_01_FULL_43_32]|uniref:DNA repair protein RecO n=1 Tax=Candidatus Nealsonbacteria bacterium RIFCSPLOWO2_01_FULL_43_32 TaxID=1801672 RepID=A0A1G2EFA1_9BACT|nr:MAG: DNA repair protein RecO [Candidatus Nealsonbacteria bacterium RIFCSPLOWO2_01_FULL_43_32]